MTPKRTGASSKVSVYSTQPFIRGRRDSSGHLQVPRLGLPVNDTSGRLDALQTTQYLH